MGRELTVSKQPRIPGDLVLFCLQSPSTRAWGLRVEPLLTTKGISLERSPGHLPSTCPCPQNTGATPRPSRGGGGRRLWLQRPEQGEAQRLRAGPHGPRWNPKPSPGHGEQETSSPALPLRRQRPRSGKGLCQLPLRYARAHLQALPSPHAPAGPLGNPWEGTRHGPACGALASLHTRPGCAGTGSWRTPQCTE